MNILSIILWVIGGLVLATGIIFILLMAWVIVDDWDDSDEEF